MGDDSGDVDWTTLDSAAFEPGVDRGQAPPWWPAGVSEQLVREAAEAGARDCQELIEALDDWREGIAPDGEHAALSAFAAGGDD